ncbi:MAG: hypothetical protein ABJI96_04160 [Paracoccaceae bacterium]
MKVIIGAISVLLISGLPASANSFKAMNRLDVNPLTATEFEVIQRPRTRPKKIWCAASDYTQNALGLPSKTEIFIKTPSGSSVTEPGKKGVGFTVDPNQVSPVKSSSVSIKTAGVSMSASHAATFCRDDRFPKGSNR